MLAIGLEGDEKQKIALLLTVAGRSALDVYNMFILTEEEKDKFDAVINKVERYCTLRKNETYERYIFRNRMQKESESIEQYVMDLKLKSQLCNFGTLCDSMIRDQIVIGVLDKRVRMHLLKEADLTLKKAMEICQAAESTREQIKTFANNSENTRVDAVQRGSAKQAKRPIPWPDTSYKSNQLEDDTNVQQDTGNVRAELPSSPGQTPHSDQYRTVSRNHFNNLEMRRVFTIPPPRNIPDLTQFYEDVLQILRDLADAVKTEARRNDVVQLELIGENVQNHVSVTISDEDDDAILPAFEGLLERLVQSNADIASDTRLELVVQVVRKPKGGVKRRLEKL
ncbi:hypothetical protein LDENG_00190110 [Lucifuga dentata]|nr:hypothetical protein LDENG_00190110 [Lucifuga dentata]